MRMAITETGMQIEKFQKSGKFLEIFFFFISMT